MDGIDYRRGGSGSRVDAVDIFARYTASIIDVVDLDAERRGCFGREIDGVDYRRDGS